MKNIFLLIFISIYSISISQNVNSVLSTGSWLKIKVDKNAVYKITYNDLLNYGFNPNTINPKNIKIYGNGNGMLPENVEDYRNNDLVENAIQVIGEEDGTFDVNDYILFYGKESTKWNYDTYQNIFVHTTNIYDDYTYYYLTVGTNVGKRITEQNSITQTPTDTVTSFNYYVLYEKDSVNLIKSGRIWLGELFSGTYIQSFNFNIPNILTNIPLKMWSGVAASSHILSSFTYKYNGQNLLDIGVGTSSSYIVGRYSIGNVEFNVNSDNVLLQVEYNQPDTSSKGWLDYIEINARRQLQIADNSLVFRDIESVGQNNISKFEISNTTNKFKVWDVTDIYNIKNQKFETVGNSINYTLTTDSLREFIAFDSTQALIPIEIQEVENQNIHSMGICDLLIVTDKLFINQANELADFHINNDGMVVNVVTTEQIYNEFSSGKQDITAIRDFVDLIYFKATNQQEKLKYLLLFGAASYDYKNIRLNNTVNVPTYETEESFSEISSIASDDFFGILDSSETFVNGLLDIGIGRLPAKTIAEAQLLVDKIINYKTNSSAFGNWRNEINFIADDGDNDLHMAQSEELTQTIETTYPCYNINKVYFDNYQRINDEFPDAKTKIITNLNNGSLLVNYIGHGDSDGTSNNVFTVDDMNNIYNTNKLSFFVGATSTMNLYDNPEDLYFGEQFLLQPNNKGFIGSLSTSRLTYASQNFVFLTNFYDILFERNTDGNHYKLGDLLSFAKNNSGSTINKKSFLLLGDPALTLNYPNNIVNVTSINNVDLMNFSDTLISGQSIDVYGQIEDFSENVLNNFNGQIKYKLYNGKKEEITLTSNFQFNSQDDVLISGTSFVSNGYFNFSLTIPYNIEPEYALTKLSLYAYSIDDDAKGCINLYATDDGNIVTNVDNSIGVEVYPTIVSNNVNIKFKNDEDGIDIFIYNNLGVLIKQEAGLSFNANDIYSIDISSYNAGMYIIKILSKNNIVSKKIIKK